MADILSLDAYRPRPSGNPAIDPSGEEYTLKGIPDPLWKIDSWDQWDVMYGRKGD